MSGAADEREGRQRRTLSMSDRNESGVNGEVRRVNVWVESDALSILSFSIEQRVPLSNNI